jgi:mercuric ion transport protein
LLKNVFKERGFGKELPFLFEKQGVIKLKEKTFTIGSVVAAILASICCIGPLVILALGLSGAGWIPALTKFRPLFIVIAILLLARVWWVVLKEGKCCEIEGRKTRSVSKDKIMLLVITFIVATLLAFPYILGIIQGRRYNEKINCYTYGYRIEFIPIILGSRENHVGSY